MIQPHEEVPGENGHPRWKQNVGIGIALAAVGVVLMITVALFVYGAVLFGVGMAWTVAAVVVGMMQERADTRSGRTIHHA